MTHAHWYGKRVLITGHTGFKGSWLTLVLRRAGAQVYGLSLDPEPGSLFETARGHEQCAWDGRGDVRDREAIEEAWLTARPDAVFHLAAESLVRRAHRTPASTFETNVMGTVHLLEAARKSSFDGPVVVVTTDKVYENDGRAQGYLEEDRLGGEEPYSASKAAAELVAATYRHSYGLKIATARAGNVIGGGDVCEARLLPDCVRAWRTGRPVDIRQPQATRPWQHVLDPIAGYLALAGAVEREPARFARGWNFGPEEDAWSVARVLDEAVKHWPGARWHRSPEPGAPPEATRLDLDVDAAMHELGWSPRWDTAESIRRTLRWEADVYAGVDPMARCLADLDAHSWPFSLRRAG